MMGTDAKSATSGRGWARFGFVVGVVASVAANIAHGFIPPADAVTGWTPSYGSIAAAAFWPLALVISVEVISRVLWPEGKGWAVLRFGGVSVVALIAAVISYQHLHGLLVAYGETGIGALIGPLAVDGLMAVCSGALVALSRAQRAVVEQPAAEVQSEAGPVGDAATPVHAEAPLTSDVPGKQRRTAKPAARRTASQRDDRTDAELLAMLAEMPRNANGTVSVRDAKAALKPCGTDRARRLLSEASLLDSKPTPSPEPQPAPTTPTEIPADTEPRELAPQAA
ncbi:DUF2637 domain-containing protein [Phytomonospora endophytica]|uniref:EF-hand domain-containing protein n=1 Tax=Phytomonospora endophytica TaxID=714109 RepID=A0A841G0L8_9ACTN|nr:DUF2637 domain-containing protein [Phytomonospora endophytica]MBB6038229.1 hypothetical protein [Phytomonospora endophytica]GIG67312.1 hypothetical protein Pen01_36070 [Phytomonospora endophytica]